jgi:hypothetical protein
MSGKRAREWLKTALHKAGKLPFQKGEGGAKWLVKLHNHKSSRRIYLSV